MTRSLRKRGRTPSRREFLQSGLAAACTLPLAPSLLARVGSNDASDRILVLVELAGGNDGLNTVIPIENDLYHLARPSLRLPRSQVHTLGDGLSLHPSLAGWHQHFQAGNLTILQGVGYPDPDRSHFESMDIWHSGTRQSRARRTGWIGRCMDGHTADGARTLEALAVGQRNVPLVLTGQRARAPSLRDPQAIRLRMGAKDNIEAELNAVRRMGKSARDPADAQLAFLGRTLLDTLRQTRQFESLDLSRSPGQATPNTALGRELELVARCVAARLPYRVYHVRLAGFDTHARQAATHAQLLRELDGATSAFLTQLERFRCQDQVVTLIYSEFGRRVRENGSRGTDHGAAAPCFLLGNRVRGGLVGEHPDLTDLDDGDLRHAIDFRQIYATLMRRWLREDDQRILGADYPLLPLFARAV